MVNYVNHITLDNTYIDPMYNLGYDRDNYELNISWKFNENLPGTIFQWEGGAFRVYNTTIEGFNINYYESFYYNGHSTDRSYDNNIPYTLRESYEEEDEGYRYRYYLISNGTYRSGGTTANKYYNRTSRIRKWGRLLIGSLENEGTADVGEISLKVDGELIFHLKPCLDGQGTECFYDIVRNIYIYPYGKGPSDSMIRTVVLTGDWQELPVNDGADVSKLRDRMTPNDKAADGYAALYDSLCITAGEYNGCPVLVSDYTENNQENNEYRKDYIELLPKGRIELPRDRAIQALNRPMVKGNAGDIVKVAVR